MRADIHYGQEHHTLYPRAGYRTARPIPPSRTSGLQHTADSGIARSTGGVEPSSRGLALVNLTVQRASRSLCRSLAGLAFQFAGIRPSLIAFFSSSVLRCRGAATRLASTI